MHLKFIFVSVSLCVRVFMGENGRLQPQTSQSPFCNEGTTRLPLCLIKMPHLLAPLSKNPASRSHRLLIRLSFIFFCCTPSPFISMSFPSSSPPPLKLRTSKLAVKSNQKSELGSLEALFLIINKCIYSRFKLYKRS